MSTETHNVRQLFTGLVPVRIEEVALRILKISASCPNDFVRSRQANSVLVSACSAVLFEQCAGARLPPLFSVTHST